jgi:hypothetical protein
MKRSVIAMTVVGALLGGGVAYAQTMEEGLTMLETAVDKEFSNLGIDDVDPMSLSLAQLSTIKGVIGSSDYNNSEKKSQIEAIVANN